MSNTLIEAHRELALANQIAANEGVIDAFGHVSMTLKKLVAAGLCLVIGVQVIAMGIAAATALLPILRERLPYGVAVIGFVLTAASVVGGASVASTFLVVCVWASAAVWALLPRRS